MTNRTFTINDVVEGAKETSSEIQQSVQHLIELQHLMTVALEDVSIALHQAQNCFDEAQFNVEMTVDTPPDILPVDTQFMNYHVDDDQVIED
jgi:hypothetical protein